MRIVCCAVPVVLAVFFRCEDLIARPAYTITVYVGIRTGVLLLISRAVPEVFAAGIQIINSFARFAVPTVFAMPIRRICPLTGRAEPVIFRANGIRRVMRFADRACPVVLAMLRFFQNTVAGRTIKTSVRANVIQRMPLFAVGTIPEIVAGFPDFNRRLTGRTVPAVGIRSGTDIIRRMVFFLRCAPPVVRTIFSDPQSLIFRFAVKFAAGTRFTDIVRTVTNGTIPGMFAFRIRIVRFSAIETVPTTVRAGFVRSVMFVTRGTCPIVVTTAIL